MLLDKKGVFVMRIMNVLALSLAAVTLIGAPANASAQIPLADILNRLEVRRLETSPNAAAHHKLAAHFSALAQRYTAIAKRYAAMARALPGNPNRETSFGREIHFKHLAELNTQWATTARELAGHHERLAAGSESVLPRGGERLEGGAGATEPSKEDLAALTANARTPADHRELEAAYLDRADQYTSEARKHAAMASAYRGTKIATAAAHCDQLVRQARGAAKEATAAAIRQKELVATQG